MIVPERLETGTYPGTEPQTWTQQTMAVPVGGTAASVIDETNASLSTARAKDDHADTRGAGATAIVPGKPLSGIIDHSTDQDWFRFDVTTKGMYSIRSSGTTNVVGELFGSTGANALTWDDNGAGDRKNFLIDKQLDPGTYYIRVSSYGSRGGAAYGLSLTRKDDHADNLSPKATPLTLGKTTDGVVDYAGDQDWFQFTVGARGKYTIQSSGNADLVGALYNSRGGNYLLTDDDGAGDGKNFSMTAELEPGTYYVWTAGTNSSVGASYGITVSEATPPQPDPNPRPNPTPPPDPGPQSHKFNIALNYDFDTEGYFAANPQFKTALESAAEAWSSVIEDDFKGIAAGNKVYIYEPTTGQANPTYTLKENVDDLMIFMGASQTPLGNPAYSNALAMGGNWGSASGKDNDFEPSFGRICYNSKYNINEDDFRLSSIHEIGHVLGIGTSGLFRSQCFRDRRGVWYFNGANARAANQGRPVKLDASGAHLSDDYKDPMTSGWTNKTGNVTDLDKAILRDLGYKVK